MNVIIKQIELIARIDQLIRLEATGCPVSLSKRLGVSKTTLYRIINTMKDLNAPVVYDPYVESFVYEEAVGFQFGFYTSATLSANAQGVKKYA